MYYNYILCSPVTTCLIVSYSRSAPPGVNQHRIFHRALVVQPAEELRRLPVLDGVVGTGGIAGTIGPYNLRLCTYVEEGG